MTNSDTWTHRLSGWHSKLHSEIRPPRFGDCEKQLYGRRRAGTRKADFMAERLEEQSFDRCDAAPQFFANYKLDVFIALHMDANFSLTIRFKIWTMHETSSVKECCTVTRLRSCLSHSMGPTSCKPAPTPSVAGSVQHKPHDDADLDMHKCRLWQ